MHGLRLMESKKGKGEEIPSLGGLKINLVIVVQKLEDELSFSNFGHPLTL